MGFNLAFKRLTTAYHRDVVFPSYISKYPGIDINVINDDDDDDDYNNNNNNPLIFF